MTTPELTKADLVVALVEARGAIDTLLARVIALDNNYRPSKDKVVWCKLAVINQVLKKAGVQQ